MENCVIRQASVSTGKTAIGAVSVVVCMTTGDFSVSLLINPKHFVSPQEMKRVSLFTNPLRSAQTMLVGREEVNE